jgi:hypothetical protein
MEYCCFSGGYAVFFWTILCSSLFIHVHNWLVSLNINPVIWHRSRYIYRYVNQIPFQWNDLQTLASP